MKTHAMFRTAVADKSIIFLSLLICIPLLIFMTYFGLPLSDESFPIAIAMRFLQGQKPFMDDLSPYMGIGLLLTPLVKLSLWFHHGKNELILFLRHAYIGFSLLCGAFAFFVLKKHLTQIAAFFFAMLIIIFHPFGINNFHYDTLSVALWSLLLVMLFDILSNKKNSYGYYAIFIFVNGLLCFVYPTFIFLLSPLWLMACLLLQDKKTFIFSSASVFFTFACLMIWLMFVYFSITMSNIENAIHFSNNLFKLSQDGQGIFHKFFLVFQQLIKHYRGYLLLALLCTSTAFFFKQSKAAVFFLIAVALILPIKQENLFETAYVGPFYFFNCIGFLGGFIFLFFLRQNDLAKRMFYFIWVPAFFAGFLTSATSYNLELNFIIGFFPASLVTLVFAYYVVMSTGMTEVASRNLLLYGIFMGLLLQANYIYGVGAQGANIYQNTIRYPMTGAFSGLYNEPLLSNTFRMLQQDLEKIDSYSNAFVYFGPVSSGYLMINHLKPGEYLLFCPYRINHFGKNMRLPAYVVDMSRWFKFSKKDIQAYFPTERAKKIVQAPFYDIYYLA